MSIPFKLQLEDIFEFNSIDKFRKHCRVKRASVKGTVLACNIVGSIVKLDASILALR